MTPGIAERGRGHVSGCHVNFQIRLLKATYYTDCYCAHPAPASLGFPSSSAMCSTLQSASRLWRIPKYHQQITSALRGSLVGTKTGSHNYIWACMACQWATLVLWGLPEGPNRHQNDVQITFCSIAAWSDYHIYWCIISALMFTPVCVRRQGLHFVI